MASFVDQPLEFAPFVQTVPVEAMVKVGMAKQQQYDAGVEKVRSYVESLSGLPISKPQIVNYLDKAMQNLKTQLKSIAGADFSDQQLVNSVGALSKQLYKDPIIQNGVRSTAEIKENYDFMEESIKKGLSSPDNEIDFRNQVTSWYNDPDLRKPYNGRYYQYTDYNKKWLEALSKLHPDENLRQVPFQTFLDPETGRMMTSDKIAQVMTEIGVKGISAEQIENAVRASMTPDVINQLRIESRVRFADVPVTRLEKIATDKYENQRTRAEEEKKRIEKLLPTLTSKPKEYAEATTYLSSLEKLLSGPEVENSLQYKLAEELKVVKDNPEQAKYELYKNGTIAQFADAFRWKEESYKYLTNPYMEVWKWQKDYDFKVQKEAFDQAIAMENLNLAKIKTQFETGVDLGMPGPGGKGAAIPGAIFEENVPGTENPQVVLSQKQKEYLQTANSYVMQLVKGLNLPENEESVNKVLAMLNEYDHGRPGGNGVGNKNVFDVRFRGAAESYWKNLKTAQDIKNKVEEVRTEVNSRYSVPNFSIKDESGNTFTFTPEEIQAYRLKKKNEVQAVSGGPGAGVTFAPQNYTAKEQKLKQLTSTWTGGFSDNLQGYLNQLDKTYVDMTKEINAGLGTVGAAYAPSYRQLPTTKEESRKTVVQTIQGFVALAGEGKGTTVSQAPSNWKDLFEDVNTAYYVQDNPNMMKKIYAVRNSKVEGVIELGPQTSTHPLVRGGPTWRDYEVGFKMSLNNGASRGLYAPSDFRNVKKLDVGADLVQGVGDLSKYLQIKVNTSRGPQVYTLNKYINIEQADNYVNNVTDAQLLQDLKTYTNIDNATLAELAQTIQNR